MAERCFISATFGKRYDNWGLHQVKTGKDVSKSKTNLVITLEGADAVQDIPDIDELHKLGIRLVTPQYGHANALADEKGLTAFGKDGIKHMLSKGIIVDLAHALPGVRRDILDLAKDQGKGKQIAYSHGAMVEDIAADRSFDRTHA